MWARCERASCSMLPMVPLQPLAAGPFPRGQGRQRAISPLSIFVRDGMGPSPRRPTYESGRILVTLVARESFLLSSVGLAG